MCAQDPTTDLVSRHILSLSVTTYQTEMATPLHIPWKSGRWQLPAQRYQLYKWKDRSESGNNWCLQHPWLPTYRPRQPYPHPGKEATNSPFVLPKTVMLIHCTDFLLLKGRLWTHTTSTVSPWRANQQPGPWGCDLAASPSRAPRADGCLQGHLSPSSFLIPQELSVITAIILTLNKTEQKQGSKGAGKKNPSICIGAHKHRYKHTDTSRQTLRCQRGFRG